MDKRNAVRCKIIISLSTLILCGILFVPAIFTPEKFFKFYSAFSVAASGFLAFLFSFTSVSVIEFLLIALCLFFLFYFIYSLIKTIRGKGGLLIYLTDLFLAVSIIIFTFFLFWGFNYMAPSPAESLKLDIRPRPEEALIATSEWLLSIILEEDGRISLNEDGSVDGGGFDILAQKLPEAYISLAEKNESFKKDGLFPPKKITFWLPFTYMGFTGVYSPFTGEANVHPEQTDAYLAFTMAHEMAHRMGFAHEDEANFAAFLACEASEEASVRYSGALVSFFYCVSQINNSSERLRLEESLPPSAWDSVKAQEAKKRSLELNEKLEAVVTEISGGIYDSYLQTMGVEEGMKSYGGVVDLLIAEHTRLFGETYT